MKAKDIYQVLFVLFWCVNVLLHVCLCTACVLGTLEGFGTGATDSDSCEPPQLNLSLEEQPVLCS